MAKKIKKPRHPKACRLGAVNPDGSEKLCSKPTELRAKIIAPISLRQKMQSLWKEFREKEINDNELETIQDSQDFDIESNQLPRTPYETEGELDYNELLPDQQLEESSNNEQVQPAEKENHDGKISNQTSEE